MNPGFLTYLRLLLAQHLPIDLVRPELQVAAKEALSFDDPERLHWVTLQVVAELVRQGDLVPAVQEKRTQKEFLWLVRTTSFLLDLTLLFSQDPMDTETETQHNMPEQPVHLKRTPQLSPDDIERALRIIEETQIGDVYEPEAPSECPTSTASPPARATTTRFHPPTFTRLPWPRPSSR